MGAINIILGLAVLAVCSSVSATSISCPEGWSYFQGSCYIVRNDIDSVYKGLNADALRGYTYDRADAEKLCATIGGHFLSLDSKAEAEFIVSALVDIPEASVYVDCMMVAGTDRAECDSCNFYSSDTCQKGFWEWDRPDWPRVDDEARCVVLNRALGKLRARSCIRHTWVCEKAAT